jgi:glycosyltransferase involved in cell wall biosynthesis
MRVAILAHGASGAGALSVARNLTAALGRVAPDHTYGVTFPPGLGYEEICERLPDAELFVRRTGGGLVGRWVWETRALPKMLRDFCPDVMLALADRGMIDPPCPQAVLVHRPQLFYPSKHYQRHSLKNRLLLRYHSRHLRKSLLHTDLLLCQTTAAQKRLIDKFGFHGRVEICPNAVSVFATAENSDQSMPDALACVAGKTRLFCLGKYYAHKNIESLIELFLRYGEELADVAVITTVAADQDPKAKVFLENIERYGLNQSIVNVGPIPQGDLGRYYGNCDALFMPTYLESFSATYIEAMHFRVPILTSDLDFAHTVCGDAAVYFDPWDASAIRDAIVGFKDNVELAKALVKNGQARKDAFLRSWDDIAEDVARWLGEITEGVL